MGPCARPLEGPDARFALLLGEFPLTKENGGKRTREVRLPGLATLGPGASDSSEANHAHALLHDLRRMETPGGLTNRIPAKARVLIRRRRQDGSWHTISRCCWRAYACPLGQRWLIGDGRGHKPWAGRDRCELGSSAIAPESWP